jgi:hypothetical protein
VPLTCLVGTVDVGAVVVVVVVVLTALTGGCVVVVVGANVPDAAGSLVEVLKAVTPCNGLLVMVGGVVPAALGSVPVSLLVCVGGLSEPLDDVVDVADGAIVASGTVDMPEGGAPSPVDVSGVGDPVAMAGLGAVGGEPGSSAKDERITTMPNTDAVPIPFCRRLMFISNLNLNVDGPLHTLRLEQ